MTENSIKPIPSLAFQGLASNGAFSTVALASRTAVASSDTDEILVIADQWAYRAENAGSMPVARSKFEFFATTEQVIAGSAVGSCVGPLRLKTETLPPSRCQCGESD